MAHDNDISITEKTFDLSLEDTEVDDDSIDQGIITTSQLMPDDHDQRPTSSQILPSNDHSSNQRLHKSLEILQRISGTEMTKINTDCNQDELSKMILELCENSELKLQFYERNYKFLENLYESVQKDHDLVKKREKLLKLEVERLKVKNRDYDLLKRCIEEKIQDKDQTDLSIDELCRVVKTFQMNKEEEKNDVIRRMEKEIKEYKRFIRELMDR